MNIVNAGRGCLQLECWARGDGRFVSLLLSRAGQCPLCLSSGWMGIWVSVMSYYITACTLKWISRDYHMITYSVSHFAELYAKKLGIRADILRQTLWGDFFLNAKAKRIYKGAQVCCFPSPSGKRLFSCDVLFSSGPGQSQEATFCAVCTREYVGSV